jgi:hypothetical protein
MSDPMPNPNDDALEPNGKLKRKEYEREKLPHSTFALSKRQDRGDSEDPTTPSASHPRRFEGASLHLIGRELAEFYNCRPTMHAAALRTRGLG